MKHQFGKMPPKSSKEVKDAEDGDKLEATVAAMKRSVASLKGKVTWAKTELVSMGNRYLKAKDDASQAMLDLTIDKLKQYEAKVAKARDRYEEILEVLEPISDAYEAVFDDVTTAYTDFLTETRAVVEDYTEIVCQMGA